MPRVPIVENPRRRRSRRSRRLTPAQLAAGFGGKSSMTHRRRSKRSGRRHRNPALAELALNPRRRRRSARYATPRRHRRRSYRNPIGATHIGPFQFDFVSAAWVAGGMVGAKVGPSLIQKVWPGMPSTGITGHAARFGVVLLGGYGVRMITKSPARSGQFVAGGIGMILYDLFNEYLAPKLGLSGLSDRYVTDSELTDVLGTGGFVQTPGVAGFVTTPDGELAY
jgi:hypothetical protein